MSVEIKIYGETAHEALKELHEFSGGMPVVRAAPPVNPAKLDEVGAKIAEVREQPHAGGAAGVASAAPIRKRGEPSPGKKRRTAAEVAEDEAAEAAETKQNISTGEARVDPENPEADDSEADAAQDAADEAAEVEAHRDPEKPLTIDDVKASVMAYAEKYGMPAAQADGPRIFVEALGAPPKGEEFWKFSILPIDDQEKTRKVISIWQRATTENPFKH